MNTSNADFGTFKKIVRKYVKSNILDDPYDPKTAKKVGSFKEILFPDIFSTQSVSIRLGNIMEKVYNDFILLCGIKDLRAANPRNQVGHQLDLLFECNDIIYYFESKLMGNLDTEKSKVTMDKIWNVERYLKSKYPNNKIVAKMLCGRFARRADVFGVKLPVSPEHIYGYAEFFELFGIQVSKEEWNDFFAGIGDTLYETYYQMVRGKSPRN